MWLDELNDLVLELSTKIDEHREIFRKSESATRYCLIDPLLTALGWDLSDPTQVLTEHETGKGRADYAMVPGDGTPSLIVEAKSLLTSTESARDQSLTYCQKKGIMYFAVTNGDDWEVYETHRPVPLDQKRVTAFKITDANQSTVMGMLWLWRGNFKGGEPAMPTSPHSVGEAPAPGSESVTNLTKTPTSVTPGKPLSEFTNATGSKPPETLTFPDGIAKPVGKWNQIQIATVAWLVETGRLNESMCPVTTPGGRVVVSTTPYRKNGKKFIAPREIEKFWVEVNYSASNQVKRIMEILNAAGVDPATVRVS